MENLIGKRFRVIVGGELERTTNFDGLLTLLHRFSDYFDFTPAERRQYWKKTFESKRAYIDANITCMF